MKHREQYQVKAIIDAMAQVNVGTALVWRSGGPWPTSFFRCVDKVTVPNAGTWFRVLGRDQDGGNDYDFVWDQDQLKEGFLLLGARVELEHWTEPLAPMDQMVQDMAVALKVVSSKIEEGGIVREIVIPVDFRDFYPIVRDTMRLTPHQRATLTVLRALGAATDEELVNGYFHMAQHRAFRLPRQTASGIRTRRTELVAHGKVRRSPVDGHTASGRRARRWEVV